MIYGNIILITIADGKVKRVESTVGQVAVVILNEDTQEEEFPPNYTGRTNRELNEKLNTFSAQKG